MLAIQTLSAILAVAPVDDLTLPPWPPSMHAERRDNGVWLDGPTATAVHFRLELLDHYPELARAIGDSRVSEALAIADEKHQVDLAQHATREQKLEQNQATTWLKVKVFGGGVGVGIVAALVYGLVHK